MLNSMGRLGLGTLILMVMAPPAALAQVPNTDPQLNESVVMVPKKGSLFTIALETTVYRPDGEGPFPLALINHGKAFGNPRFQERYRPVHAVRYFLQRGYAVIVPMRQGFSKSEGSYIGGGCNVESNGRVQAEDVRAVLDFAVAQPWADRDRVIVLGQSHGGWTTLALGAENPPGVKALVNFAGGLKQTDCTAWERNLALGAASYAQSTRVPSLWFYGDNDSYFNPYTYRAMYEQYTGAGGMARLVAFGTFGTDAHSMFGSRKGLSIWQPEVSKFLASVGLPHEPDSRYGRFSEPPATPAPPKTDFAPIDDDSKVPWIRTEGRRGYQAFLTKPPPRAFAIGPRGAWGWSSGSDDPLQRALDHCNKNSGDLKDCRLYAVDEDVVWPVN